MAEGVSLLVADDHPVVRTGLSTLFGTLDGIVVVAEAADGEAAVREALLSHPDVVVLDLRMPKLEGIEVIRRLRAALPRMAVLVLTMFDDDSLVAEALEAGARGHLLKGAEAEEIERAVRAVAGGSAILAPAAAPAAAAAAAARALRRPAGVVDPFPTLATREHEVLDQIARGLSIR